TAGAPHTNMYWKRTATKAYARDYGLEEDKCGITDDVPGHFTEDAALVALTNWVAEGKAAPHSERIALTTGANGKPDVQRDDLGPGLGGTHPPRLAVPMARYSTRGPCEELSKPLPDAEILKRYGTREAYLTKFKQAVADAEKAGFLLPADGKTEIAEAE